MAEEKSLRVTGTLGDETKRNAEGIPTEAELERNSRIKCPFLRGNEKQGYICGADIKRIVSEAHLENFCHDNYQECTSYKGR
ncbi:MAG: hypothetical protein ABIH49_02270 [archaeon]